MPPYTQQELLQSAEEAARQLSTTLQDGSVAQLLQHPPPAAVLRQQQDSLNTCTHAMITVMSTLAQVSNGSVRAEQVRCCKQRV
jgi:hypothetical protein